jgi:hypothetical protein
MRPRLGGGTCGDGCGQLEHKRRSPRTDGDSLKPVHRCHGFRGRTVDRDRPADDPAGDADKVREGGFGGDGGGEGVAEGI